MRLLPLALSLALAAIAAAPTVAAASNGPTVTVREYGRYDTRRTGIRHKAVRTASATVRASIGS